MLHSRNFCTFSVLLAFVSHSNLSGATSSPAAAEPSQELPPEPSEPQQNSTQSPPADTPAAAPVSETSLVDTVELQNGAYLRGLIVELDPERHLLFRLADGTVKTIPLAELKRVEQAGRELTLPQREPAPSELPPPAAGPPALPQHPAFHLNPDSSLAQELKLIPGPRVKLEIQANQPAQLQRRIHSDSEFTSYYQVCSAPCQLELPAQDPALYRIGSLRTDPTEWFQLPQRDSRLDAELVHSSWASWPRATFIGGAILTGIGGAFLGAYALSDKNWTRDTGIIVGSIGVTALLTSGILWLVRPHSQVTVSPLSF